MSGVLKPKKGTVTWFSSSQIPSQQGQKIGYVPQDFTVFNGTLLENISMKRCACEKCLLTAKKCLADVSLMKFFNNLPEGLETKLEERGVNLSGGQKQRIALARELFREPDILLMDEATSSLDDVTTEIVERNISKLKGKLTVVKITHKIKSLKSADRILLIDKGKITQCESLEDLLSLNLPGGHKQTDMFK